MAGNRTLTIIKPDAFNSGKAGSIIALLEKAGFKVIASRVMRLSEAQAQAFYAVHRERSFFAPLVRFMTSGKCMPMVLERADAVDRSEERRVGKECRSRGRAGDHEEGGERRRGQRGSGAVERELVGAVKDVDAGW